VRTVRRDAEVLSAIVSGAGEVRLPRVAAVRRSGGSNAAGSSDRAVEAVRLIYREVGEADVLAGVVIGEGA
jgi:hypothetical protein